MIADEELMSGMLRAEFSQEHQKPVLGKEAHHGRSKLNWFSLDYASTIQLPKNKQ
jgi:hypothetical protein